MDYSIRLIGYYDGGDDFENDENIAVIEVMKGSEIYTAYVVCNADKREYYSHIPEDKGLLPLFSITGFTENVLREIDRLIDEAVK